MSNALPIALTRLLKYSSIINSVSKCLTHMTTMPRVGLLEISIRDSVLESGVFSSNSST